MTRRAHSPWFRCLLVWLAATGTVAVLGPWLLDSVGRPAEFEDALVALMSCAGVLAGAWLWVLVSLTAYDAARGRASRLRAGVPLGVRRAVLAACGVALTTGGLAVPADADDGHPPPSVLSGLPLPDRPTTLGRLGLAFQVADAAAHPGRRRAAPHSHQAPGAVVVRDGDTLWAIAQRHLSPTASDDAVGRACSRLYLLNRAVIGDDPDLIRPGQRLQLPHLTQEDS